MKTINLRSVVWSGFLAGIIINISALAMVPVFGDAMHEALAGKGLPPLGPLSAVYFCFVSFVFGFFLVFLISLLKPHIRSGIATAVVAALIVWVIAYVLSNVSLAVYGFMPLKLVVIGTLWGLGELLVASFAGVKLYKEAVQCARDGAFRGGGESENGESWIDYNDCSDTLKFNGVSPRFRHFDSNLIVGPPENNSIIFSGLSAESAAAYQPGQQARVIGGR